MTLIIDSVNITDVTVAPLPQPEFEYNLEPPDWVALRVLLRKIDEELAMKRRHLLMKVAHWFLALDLLREFEDTHLILEKSVSRDSEYHRVVLTGLMSHGESLLIQLQNQQEIDPAKIGVQLSDVAANVRYLRDLYARWYTDMTDNQKDEILSQLFSGPASDTETDI